MTQRTLSITEELHAYMLDVSLREDAICKRIREQTAKMAVARMQVAPEQAQFMAMLVRIIGAKRILEIGTFTGYSALWMAQALPEDGVLVTLDKNLEWTRRAKRDWADAGVAQKIHLRIGDARETLQQIHAEGEAPFDLIFIDADKENLEHYYDQGLSLLAPKGLMLVDNVLWSGKVLDVEDQDPCTLAVRAFNQARKEDHRIELCLLPIADGLTMIRKKSASGTESEDTT
ncbi:MAG: class I SAM-dependent methyltransferase [Myxococcota bacterium]